MQSFLICDFFVAFLKESSAKNFYKKIKNVKHVKKVILLINAGSFFWVVFVR